MPSSASFSPPGCTTPSPPPDSSPPPHCSSRAPSWRACYRQAEPPASHPRRHCAMSNKNYLRKFWQSIVPRTQGDIEEEFRSTIVAYQEELIRRGLTPEE